MLASHHVHATQAHPLTKCTYSHDDLRAVVAFARDRGIRVVPEFDTPSHVASWAVGYPGFTLLCDCDDARDCPPAR